MTVKVRKKNSFVAASRLHDRFPAKPPLGLAYLHH